MAFSSRTLRLKPSLALPLIQQRQLSVLLQITRCRATLMLTCRLTQHKQMLMLLPVR